MWLWLWRGLVTTQQNLPFWPLHNHMGHNVKSCPFLFTLLAWAMCAPCHPTRSADFLWWCDGDLWSRNWSLSFPLAPSRIDATSRWVWVNDDCLCLRTCRSSRVQWQSLQDTYPTYPLDLRPSAEKGIPFHFISLAWLVPIPNDWQQETKVFDREQSRQILYERNNVEMCNVIHNLGSLNYQFCGDQTMQIYGNFGEFPLYIVIVCNSALFRSVTKMTPDNWDQASRKCV